MLQRPTKLCRQTPATLHQPERSQTGGNECEGTPATHSRGCGRRRILCLAQRSCPIRLSVIQPPHSTPPQGIAPLSASAASAPVEIGTALERLMARFAALARHAARARGLPAEEIDEILQDVRIRLWKAHPESENLERLGASYFVKVVSSAVIDRLRRRRQQETSLDAVTALAVVPEALQVLPPDVAEQNALAVRLEQALATLPRNRRLVVQLHLEGYGRDEMAGMTGWTEAKVRNLLYRGLEDLRERLRSDGGTRDG